MDESFLLKAEKFFLSYPIQSMENLENHPLTDRLKQDPIWEIAKNEKNCCPFDPYLMTLFLFVRNLNKTVFQKMEGQENFEIRPWRAADYNRDTKLQGGGVMTVLRAKNLEKAAVNLSCVWGPRYPALEGEYAGKPFAAAGVSLISHPKNPYAPIMHMNIRCIKVLLDHEAIIWIGGGADLTPMVCFEEDTTLFHKALETACQRTPRVGDYQKYKKWADEYYFIPHRKEARGVGGIFFDFVKIQDSVDFSFLLDVGQYAAHAYTQILANRLSLEYDSALHEKHLYWRGRYAEFNLVYDRGTKFGLMTGGNHEAIFCSLPPQVRW